ncbi:hypothetical protein RYX36_019984 [Vicia faba]
MHKTMLHRNSNRDERIAAHEFFLTLTAYSTVIPILTDGGFYGCGISESNGYVECIGYQSESQDEQTLVFAASAYGHTLLELTSGHIVIDINDEKLRLDVLNMHTN